MPLRNIDTGQYAQLLQHKTQRIVSAFEEFEPPELQVFDSSPTAFRLRAEFRMWHEGDDLFYAMFRPGDPRTAHAIEHFPIAAEAIQDAMPLLLEQLKSNDVLRRKLFQVEFLSTLSGDLLVTLIYHRTLEESWQLQAQQLQALMETPIIGRARKQKLVLQRDYVEETLLVNGETFSYRQYEQSFTQPNGEVNQKMITWACDVASHCKGDLLELYCGNGNFTLPLARHFDHVLATEVAKSSVKSARHNIQANKANNIQLARLSAEEVASAISGEREFRRLRELERDLDEYNFSTVFVDPPRAGLDAQTEHMVAQYDNIIYVSCNPDTLAKNLEQICQTHSIEKMALFDQFPYTDHCECGVFLRKNTEF